MQKLMHYIVYRRGMFAADRSFDIAFSVTGASANFTSDASAFSSSFSTAGASANSTSGVIAIDATAVAIVSAKFRRYANTSQCYMGVITALLGRHTCPVELFL